MVTAKDAYTANHASPNFIYLDYCLPYTTQAGLYPNISIQGTRTKGHNIYSNLPKCPRIDLQLLLDPLLHQPNPLLKLFTKLVQLHSLAIEPCPTPLLHTGTEVLHRLTSPTALAKQAS